MVVWRRRVSRSPPIGGFLLMLNAEVEQRQVMHYRQQSITGLESVNKKSPTVTVIKSLDGRSLSAMFTHSNARERRGRRDCPVRQSRVDIQVNSAFHQFHRR